MTNSKEVLIPILVGVTGHRDLRKEDWPNLELSVRAIFEEIRSKYENTPIKVLSPLAEGADRLVAKVGLEIGATLIVPLPMPRSEYEKDFETEESKKEFAELLAKAEVVYELPLLEGNTVENIQIYGEQRNRQYACVGAYVALHSQILIALWNGKKSEETGSTAAVVRFKLEGIPSPYAALNNPLDLPDNGPVYHIFAGREIKQSDVTQNNHSPEVDCLVEKCKVWDVLYPAGWKSESTERARIYYDGLLKRIDKFNSDVSMYTSPDKIKASKSYIFPEEKQAALTPGLAEVLYIYGKADVAAQHFQARVDKALKWLVSMPVIAFFFFGAFDELWSRAYMLVLLPTIFVVAYLFYRHTIKKDYDRKFCDYRALAEGLRVQFFWKLSGLQDKVTDHYHRKYKGEMNWIFHAMRNIGIKANMEVEGNKVSDRRKRLEMISAHWIEDQRRYFEKNAIKRRDRAEAQEKFTLLFFATAMVLVFGIFAMKAILMIQQGQGSFENFLNMEDIKNWQIYSVFLVLIDTCVAVGAARSVYVEKKGFKEEAKQFQRMKDLFQKGNNVMIECLKKDDLKGAEKLVIELGKEALTENGDWLILRRSKPMEVPLG